MNKTSVVDLIELMTPNQWISLLIRIDLFKLRDCRQLLKNNQSIRGTNTHLVRRMPSPPSFRIPASARLMRSFLKQKKESQSETNVPKFPENVAGSGIRESALYRRLSDTYELRV